MSQLFLAMLDVVRRNVGPREHQGWSEFVAYRPIYPSVEGADVLGLTLHQRK